MIKNKVKFTMLWDSVINASGVDHVSSGTGCLGQDRYGDDVIGMVIRNVEIDNISDELLNALRPAAARGQQAFESVVLQFLHPVGRAKECCVFRENAESWD